jgi:hypothetical protein
MSALRAARALPSRGWCPVTQPPAPSLRGGFGRTTSESAAASLLALAITLRAASLPSREWSCCSGLPGGCGRSSDSGPRSLDKGTAIPSEANAASVYRRQFLVRGSGLESRTRDSNPLDDEYGSADEDTVAGLPVSGILGRLGDDPMLLGAAARRSVRTENTRLAVACSGLPESDSETSG